MRLNSLTVTITTLLALLALAGCARVEVVDRFPPSTDEIASIPTQTPAKHDLAVLAIDFDPPLEYEQLTASPEGVTLLVAVENSGLCTETDVKVKVELSSDEGHNLIVRRISYIDAIAPGEVKIARFKNLSRIPYRPTYRLRVQVLPVQGEVNKANNRRGYDLYVVGPR